MIVVLIILFTSRMPTRTPMVTYYMFFEAFWYMFITTFTFVYTIYVIIVRKKADELNYYIWLMFWMPIHAGICANLSEGFPVFSGIVSQRHWFGISGVFFLVYLLQMQFITLKDIFRGFEWVGWGCLFYFIWCYIFLDPKQYLDTSFVGYSDIKGGYRFKFGIDFIAFLGLYYTIKYVKDKKSKMLFYSAIFLSYMFFLHQGRSVMLAILGSIAVFYMFEVNLLRALRIFVTVTISFLFIMGVMYAIIPDRVNDYIYQYTSLATVVFTGNTSGESSVDARLEEIAILLIYMQTYSIGWLIGLGKFASSESTVDPDGSHNITTVPPGDIGILGSVMTYGILGTLFIYFQFFIAFRSFKFVRKHKSDPFFTAAKYILVFCFLSSLAKGYLFMQPGSTAIFIMVVYMYKLVETNYDKVGLSERWNPKTAF
ncbi:MAG: hypothetical protein ACKVPJ_07190 [Chitinophagales bacterium]